MIDALITHLRDNTTSFVTITHAHTSEPIDVITEETPAAYLWLDSESAASNGMLGIVVQDVTRMVHVFLVARHADMDSLRAEFRSEAIGFAADSHAPLEFVEGRVAAINGEWMWWLDVYSTRTEYRQF